MSTLSTVCEHTTCVAVGDVLGRVCWAVVGPGSAAICCCAGLEELHNLWAVDAEVWTRQGGWAVPCGVHHACTPDVSAATHCRGLRSALHQCTLCMASCRPQICLAQLAGRCTGAGGLRPLEAGAGGAVAKPDRASSALLTGSLRCLAAGMVPQCRQSRQGDTHFCSCRLAHGLSSSMFALLCSALLRHQFCVRSLLQAPDAPYASGSTCTMYAIYTFPMSNRVCNHCRCSSSQRSTPRRLTCASPQ